MQHLNGLLKATSGHIYYNGEDIYDEDYDLRQLRNKVGMVFQYPEHQLFETTNFEDVCFGPKNQGLDRKTVELEHMKLFRMYIFLKICIISRHLICQADKRGELP